MEKIHFIKIQADVVLGGKLHQKVSERGRWLPFQPSVLSACDPDVFGFILAISHHNFWCMVCLKEVKVGVTVYFISHFKCRYVSEEW